VYTTCGFFTEDQKIRRLEGTWLPVGRSRRAARRRQSERITNRATWQRRGPLTNKSVEGLGAGHSPAPRCARRKPCSLLRSFSSFVTAAERTQFVFGVGNFVFLIF